jgi:hypothetical protein
MFATEFVPVCKAIRTERTVAMGGSAALIVTHDLRSVKPEFSGSSRRGIGPTSDIASGRQSRFGRVRRRSHLWMMQSGIACASPDVFRLHARAEC